MIDNLWIQIPAAIVLGMMLFFLYPTAKRWWQHGPKAQSGDWNAVLLPLAAVFGLILLLIWMVRNT